MRRRGVLLMVVGVLAALAAGVLVYALSTRGPAPAPVPTAVAVAATVTPVPLQQVLLAAHDIASQQLVTAADVVTRSYPVGIAPADTFSTPAEIISRTTTTRVFQGELLLARQFTGVGEGVGTSPQLPAGKVLVAFPSSDMLSGTGAVHAGDHVDILLTLPVSGTTALNPNNAQEAGGSKPLVAQATMQNVTIFSTGQWTPSGPRAAGDTSTTANGAPAPLTVITFVVDHQEALILKYIKDSGGTIDLEVRSASETKAVNTDPVSLDYLIELFHFVPVKAP